MGETERSGRRFADIDAWTRVHWLAVVLAAALGTLNVGLGLAVGDAVFLVVGAVFYLGVLLFFTRYWHTALYAVAALHTLALGVVWVLAGMQYFPLGVVTGIAGIAFIAVVLALFFRDESAGVRVGR